MSPRNVLLVATEVVDERLIRKEVDRGSHVRIVIPASNLSALEWLTSDEDEARAEAERTAGRVSGAVERRARIEAGVGDSNPVLAVEDALRTFPADEIVLVDKPGSSVVAGELSRFRLPVRRLAFAREGM